MNFVSIDAERDRSKEKRRPSKRPEKEKEERDRKDGKQSEGKSNTSKDEKTREEAEKEVPSDEAKDVSSPGIKVKTLEEILREKALKKLEERRAQAKSEEQKEAKEGKAEESLSDGEKDANKSEEEESGVMEFETNAKPSSDGKDDNSIESSSEKPTVARKVSLNDKRSPVKKVLGLKKNSINSKDNNSADSSTEKATVTKRVSANAEENKSVEEKANANEPPSPFQEVKVKSFEEIMQAKRKRKAEQEGVGDSSQDLGGELTGQENSSTTAASSIPPKRLKRIVRKSSGDSDKDAKVVSSSAAETGSKVKPGRKRTVYVMDKTSQSKDSKENGM